MFDNLKNVKGRRQLLLALFVGFAVVSFWRGVWGLMDEYLFLLLHKLQQVFLNFITNAYQAMKGKGQITIKTVTKNHGKNICAKISDTGPGIPGDQHDKVFDLFHSTKSGGTGVGLAITKNIIQAHGGNIRFKELEVGTEFIIELPLS